MSKYLVNTYGDQWEDYCDARDVARFIIEEVKDYFFDDILDDEGYIEVYGMEYAPSTILKKVDPIAYSCAKCDWLDGEYSEIVYSLERMYNGEEETFYDWVVRYEETEKEE